MDKLSEEKRIELLQSGFAVAFNCRKGMDKKLKEYINFNPQKSVENDKWEYVGRKTYPKWTFNSEFGNRVGRGKDNETACKLFREYFENNQELRNEAIKKLKGKALGCWCYPCDCHAEILADFVNNRNDVLT